MKLSRCASIALAIVLVLALGLTPGCAEKEAKPSPSPVTPTEPVAPSEPIAPATEPVTPEPVPPPLKTAQRLLYFNRGEYLGVAGRDVPDEGDLAARIKWTMQALLTGPTAQELGWGLTGTCIPAGTVVNAVTVAGHVATVDLSSRFESGGGSLSMLLRVAQVVYTVTQFDGIDRVAFKLDGKPAKAIGGEGVIVSPPVSRADFEGQAPPILAESPVPGQTVRSPIHASGSANVFEAQFNVEVKGPNGKVIASKPVKATSGTGTRGTFETTIPYTGSPTGPGTVVFFDISEKDGSRLDVIEIPVVMR